MSCRAGGGVFPPSWGAVSPQLRRYKAGFTALERDIKSGVFVEGPKRPLRHYLWLRFEGGRVVGVEPDEGDRTEGRSAAWWAGYRAALDFAFGK